MGSELQVFLAKLDFSIYGNSLSRWLVGILVSSLFYWFARWILRVSLSRVSTDGGLGNIALLQATRTLLRTPNALLLFLLSLSLAASIAGLSQDLRSPLLRLTKLALIFQLGLWCSALTKQILPNVLSRWSNHNTAAQSATHLIRLSLVASIWAIVGLILLSNLGIDITALITGLGIGGVAIALAVQSVLGDLFASLSIILDRPFEVGDFIVVGDLKGKVEKIGIKTTRLRSLSGEELIFSNSDLLSSRIQNFKRMYERRVLFQVGVVYETPLEKLKQIPDTIKNIVSALPKIRFDRANFVSFGDSALNFEVVYFVLSSEFNDYINAQQFINFEIMRLFDEDAIEFAYPTHRVLLEQLTKA